MNEYWTDHEVTACLQATSFGELAQIALTILPRMPKPVGQVCGPISTGGVGSIEANLTTFAAWIQHLTAKGLTIFDQMPFEAHFFRILQYPFGRQNNELLEGFYKPLFESCLVTTLYFIPGWQSSYGATWEHNLVQSLGLKIVYLDNHSAL